MSDLSFYRHEPGTLPALPEASTPISIRKAVMGDYPFIDALQKSEPRKLGFQFESALKKRIEQGNILIAETDEPRRHEGHEGRQAHHSGSSSCASRLRGSSKTPVGYVLGVDRYYKRDDLGIIYQMAVVPEYRRSLVAAHLLKAKFEDSAYGCKLYCCWCAQDLTEANRFWEAMGFVPLAFRTGSEKTKFVNAQGEKVSGGRIHIFWQKRIRLGDTETPWWYPSETSGGAVGANRIALPIPPGTHWSDAKPVVLPPELTALPPAEESEAEPHAKAQRRKGKQKKGAEAEVSEKQAEPTGGLGGFAVGFGPTAEQVEAEQKAKEEAKRAKQAKKKAERARLKTNDPKLCAFSRELRDRWQEHVEQQPGLIESAAQPRYDVGRLIAPAPGSALGNSFTPAEPPEVIAEVIDEPRPTEMKRLDAA
jgi:hypothetical protein